MARKRVLGPRSPRLGALGDAIVRTRQNASISQEELGRRSGVHQTHVRGIERGVRNPTYETLLKVAEGLETTVGALTTLADGLYGQAATRRRAGKRRG
jgi:transcriptional regulator with XRE-family HTH domain